MSQQTGDWNTLVPVTGEAVALDLRLAQFPSRMLALFLDLLIQLVLLIIVVWLVGSTLSSADGAAAAAITVTMIVLVLVGWPTLIETLTRGRSLGKVAAGLRVVRDDGGPVRFRHSFVRALFMIVDFWLTSGSVGLIASLASQRGKRVGDQFAGTVVIRERVPSAARVVQHAYAMPPGLEGWASTADLARLPDVTAQQARQLLTRAATLEPSVRDSLGRQLAAEVQAYVAPPPPQGTHPEAYLAAVLTQRMRTSSAAAERARQQGARPMPAAPAPAAMPAVPVAPAAPLPPAAADPDGFAPPA
ncbi:MAG: RDD family protein [Candidatus Nanopelagicales bacterium]